MPQMKLGIWNISMKRIHETRSLNEIGNIGSGKLPNFAIWEEGKYEIGKMK